MASAFIGLDLSLNGTAGVMLDDAGKVVRVLAFSTSAREVARFADSVAVELHLSPEVHAGDTRGSWARTVGVAHRVHDWLARVAPGDARVAIEDHAWGARGTAVYQLGHLHGLVRRDVQGLGLPFLLVEPSALKRAATGSGSADKAQMIVATETAGFAVRQFLGSTRHNVADAYWLAHVMRSWDALRIGARSRVTSPSMLSVLLPGKRQPGLLAREMLP